MKRFFALLLAFVLTLSFAPNAQAEESEAADITQETTKTVDGFRYTAFLFDKDYTTANSSEGNLTITLENPSGMGSLYLIFDWEYGEYKVTDNQSGKVMTAGTYDFLHEYLDLEGFFGYAPTSVTVSFERGSVTIGELYVFSSGKTPDFVQKWNPPLEAKADILLFSAHGDDDHLYFAGMMPYYAGERGQGVQVVYMTSHRNYTTVRTHEVLNGLWGVGVTAYPVFGEYFDFRNDSLEGTYRVYANNGIQREDMVGFVVEQIRRFKPIVVLGHDINGEYGHGMHKAYSDLVRSAVEISMNPYAYAQSAEQYGTWDVPKTYLHMYDKNPIVLNFDTPLSRFDGLTAFQVSQKYGYPAHKSQHIYPDFGYWLYGRNGEITQASQIQTHSPCKYGLYRSTVGLDVQKDDFLENVTSYSDAVRLEQERQEAERLEAERQEQERLEAERQEELRKEEELLEAERQEAERQEAERLEQERLEEEQKRKEEELREEQARQEAEKQEQERLEKEEQTLADREAERLEREKRAAEAAKAARERRERLMVIGGIAFLVVVFTLLTLYIIRQKKRKNIFENY